MGFDIILKNGYTGKTVRLNVSPEDTIEGLIDKAGSIWYLPDVPHTVLLEKKFISGEETLFNAKVPRNSCLEIVPDPTA